jgi:release factor glutamine methyltransferase
VRAAAARALAVPARLAARIPGAPAVAFGPLVLLVPPGAYAPRSDTALLAGHLPRAERVLELCTGTGALALTAAARGAARVVAIDRSRRAVAAARLNAALNGLRLDVRRGDLFGALHPGERFDLIVANPPYLPAPDVARPDPRWDAGHDGREVLDRILAEAPAHLLPGGTLALVQSALAGTDRTLELLRAHGMAVGEPVEAPGRLGPIVAARREALVGAGLLAPAETTETLAVLTARRPAHDASSTRRAA